jgi:uncharacterized membrane protein
MVGLRASAGHDGVGALGKRVGHDEFQLPDFVPGEFHPGEIVSFNIDLDPHFTAYLG